MVNVFFLSKSPSEAARCHSDIHIVKMILETAQLLCNVHHRAREEGSHCIAPYTKRSSIPYKDSGAAHRKLGVMIWASESLGNYRWCVRLGLALCREYNSGRARAQGKSDHHKTQAVLEWLRDHEPNFVRKRFKPMERRHLAMPNKFKGEDPVVAYRKYYYSKRLTMTMEWPEGREPFWWGSHDRRRTKRAKQDASLLPKNGSFAKLTESLKTNQNAVTSTAPLSDNATLPVDNGIAVRPAKRLKSEQPVGVKPLEGNATDTHKADDDDVDPS